jgi:hypothetical protein
LRTPFLPQHLRQRRRGAGDVVRDRRVEIEAPFRLVHARRIEKTVELLVAEHALVHVGVARHELDASLRYQPAEAVDLRGIRREARPLVELPDALDRPAILGMRLRVAHRIVDVLLLDGY